MWPLGLLPARFCDLGRLPAGQSRAPWTCRFFPWTLSSSDPCKSLWSVLEPEVSSFWQDCFIAHILTSMLTHICSYFSQRLKLSVLIYKSFCDLGPHDIQYYLSAPFLSVEINNLWILAFAVGLLVSEKINKSVHLPFLLSHTLHAYMNQRRYYISLACYTPLIRSPEVIEFDWVTGWGLLQQPTDARPSARSVFSTGLCKSCPLDGVHTYTGAQDIPRIYCPSCHQSTIKILMSVHLKELAKPYVTIWEIRTRLVLEVD